MFWWRLMHWLTGKNFVRSLQVCRSSSYRMAEGRNRLMGWWCSKQSCWVSGIVCRMCGLGTSIERTDWWSKVWRDGHWCHVDWVSGTEEQSADPDATWLKRGKKSQFGYRSYLVVDAQDGYVRGVHTILLSTSVKWCILKQLSMVRMPTSDPEANAQGILKSICMNLKKQPTKFLWTN